MTSLDFFAASLTGQTKLTSQHRQRLAYIYVRQSSPKQVEHNRESQFIQYHLAQRAQELGWRAEQVRVIDADLGRSASSATHRDGFKDLVAEVSLGRVGIIFGNEVSRLARNNSDWYQLLDLAALFATLIADQDGIYDPRLYNDRLLLGLKGAMSEAELHLIHQRLAGGRLNQVQRGELRQHLPTGLCRLEEGRVVKDPDDQVRHTIELVFNRFEQLGSCRQVARSMRQDGISLPRRQVAGLAKGQLLFKAATEAAVYEILQNPAYAGAFAYGRKAGDPHLRDLAHPSRGRVRKAQAEWLALKQDKYPAYISWEQYLANQKRLSQNATSWERNKQQAGLGSARSGPALLQGLVVCGVCGHHLFVGYHKGTHYLCKGPVDKLVGCGCTWVSGASLERAVEAAFFEALQPAQLDALEAVLTEQQHERQQLLEVREERVKRARYAAQLAQRQYSRVDPDNRLVAAELERRWEQALQQSNVAEEEYERYRTRVVPNKVPVELAEQFRQISLKLPELWQSGQLNNQHKKELLRSLVERVIVKWEKPDSLEVRLVWVSGHYTLLHVQPPVHCNSKVEHYPALVARAHELWLLGLSEVEIAAQLTQEGFRSARNERVTAATARDAREYYQGQHPEVSHLRPLHPPGYLTVQALARQHGFDHFWLYRQIQCGKIEPEFLSRHHRRHTYLIKEEPSVIAKLKPLWEQQALRRSRKA